MAATISSITLISGRTRKINSWTSLYESISATFGTGRRTILKTPNCNRKGTSATKPTGPINDSSQIMTCIKLKVKPNL